MIVTNSGTEAINLVLNGRIVSIKHTQACELSEREYSALKNIFPALKPVETFVATEDVTEEEPEVKPAKRKKKTK